MTTKAEHLKEVKRRAASGAWYGAFCAVIDAIESPAEGHGLGPADEEIFEVDQLRKRASTAEAEAAALRGKVEEAESIAADRTRTIVTLSNRISAWRPVVEAAKAFESQRQRFSKTIDTGDRAELTRAEQRLSELVRALLSSEQPSATGQGEEAGKCQGRIGGGS